MPRFKIGCKYLLNTELQNMGMNLAFDQNLADFSKISDLQQLYISRVIHKTQVEVNEEGTEAAAVTAVEITTTSIHIYEVMNVNKPYIFLIRERSTGVILFAAKIGHVTKY
jgi:serpin B